VQPIVDCKDAVSKFGNEESRGIYLLVNYYSIALSRMISNIS